MKAFSESQERMLLGLAVFGFLVPNGAFVYLALTDWPSVMATLQHPVTLALWSEATLLLAIFTWIIARNGNPKPGWAGFLGLSLVGSLACSVPAFLYWWSRQIRASSSQSK